MTGLGTWWRTLRHLKARQIAGRVRLRLHRPRPRLGPAPPRRAAQGAWALPARRAPSLVGPTRLRFLNVEHDLEAVGWDDARIEKLWRYNLHYFDDLNASGAAERGALQRALVQRWVEQNPPPRGTGWEPYPVSLRIVNWVKWSLGGQALAPDWAQSLAVQARWLAERLEYHLLGNHLFANAKALVFAGLFFAGKEAARWLARGLRILGDELDEQVLPDGGHFERSPMYHALALEDLLDLVNVVDAYGEAAPPAARALARRLRARVPAMQRWLRAMSHPDGTLARFNDTAEGIAPDAAELARYASALGMPPSAEVDAGAVALQPSGYVRVSAGPAVALLDVAPIGPDYLPGHAHADTLSFELSVGGRRLVVNGGTSRYGTDAARHRERSTASHSTVEVAGESSSEVWAGFRVGRRARPVDPQVAREDGDAWRVACAHDGYAHLPGRPLHRREWRVDARGMTVADTVSRPELEAVARYLLAPGVAAEHAGRAAWTLIAEGRRLATVEVERGEATLDEADCALGFGAVTRTPCLTVRLDHGRAVTRWRWHDDAHPVPDRQLPARGQRAGKPHA